MCGIIGIFDAHSLSKEDLRQLALARSKLIRHRGPDWSGIYVFYDENNKKGDDGDSEEKKSTSAALAHERLSIVDPESGAQPLFSDDGTVVLAANGEIYNHEEIRQTLSEYPFKTKSDCEVIVPLYQRDGPEFVRELNGMFAFILWDEKKKSFYAARDHMGIIPLYIGWRSDGGVVFASEMKAICGICPKFEIFPPGHYFDSSTYDADAAPGTKSVFRRWYEPIWMDPKWIPDGQMILEELRGKFEHAVLKCMMTDVPWGVLLSGGLDSSLVASVATRHALRKASAWPKIHSFSVGLVGSPDLAAARIVANYLNTKHHEFTFTIQEGLDAIRDVIYALETYDTTTIRAATPMYLMSRKIKANGVKMVLSGEGSDEAMAGYLYFHKAPNKEALHEETVNKLFNLHYFDCLRANKAMSAFGVEPRVPFLDKDFLDYVMTVDPDNKLCKIRKGDEKRKSIEKFMIRKAFDTPDDPYLPESILWRQKEQFSDGVGYGWINALRDRAEAEVTNKMWTSRARRFPYNTPATKEAYAYREIFEEFYPGDSAMQTVPGGPSVACSTPAAIQWDVAFQKLASATGGECSGRSIAGVHDSAYEDTEAVVSGKKKADTSDVAAPISESPSKKAKKA